MINVEADLILNRTTRKKVLNYFQKLRENKEKRFLCFSYPSTLLSIKRQDGEKNQVLGRIVQYFEQLTKNLEIKACSLLLLASEKKSDLVEGIEEFCGQLFEAVMKDWLEKEEVSFVEIMEGKVVEEVLWKEETFGLIFFQDKELKDNESYERSHLERIVQFATQVEVEKKDREERRISKVENLSFSVSKAIFSSPFEGEEESSLVHFLSFQEASLLFSPNSSSSLLSPS